MHEQFEGVDGKRRLLQVFLNQELVQHNDALAEILTQVAAVADYEGGAEIFSQGEPGRHSLYFVISGSFGVIINGHHVRTVGPGEAIGEFPILDPGLRHTVTIRAREQSTIASIPEGRFLEIAHDHPQIWKNMAQMLVRRLRGTAESLPFPKEQCVFIGHGHSDLWRRVERFIQELGIRVVAFESESRAGKSIETVLKEMLGEATFAVLVLTAEDETSERRRRPRQNVVHEAGLFQGTLGFDRAIMLVQSGLEEFSNVAGLQHISFEGNKIDATFPEVKRALQREKVIEGGPLHLSTAN